MKRHRLSPSIVRAAIGALVACAACTLAVGATAAGQRAEAGPTFKKVGSWGKGGAGNGQFSGNAYGVATDRTGKVYVADPDNKRVQVFTAKGGFVRKLQFAPASFAQDVAVAPDGSAWVTDLNAGKAQQFSSSGAPLASIGTPKTARGIAVDAEGNVFIVTAGDNIQQVGRYDKTATGWEPGKTWGGFQDPHDVEVSPDGSVYVSDNRGLNIKRFDANGKLLKTIKGGVSAPIGIGVDLDCNVWMTNISQRRLDRLSPSGKLLGSATSGDLIAQDVAVGPTGDLYAFDAGARSIVHLAEDRSKPRAATIGAVTVAKKGSGAVARIKYTLSGVACPAQVDATASLTGKGISGKAAVKVAAGRATTIEIPLKAPKGSGKATFKIVLKTNGRPTTESSSVTVVVP